MIGDDTDPGGKTSRVPSLMTSDNWKALANGLSRTGKTAELLGAYSGLQEKTGDPRIDEPMEAAGAFMVAAGVVANDMAEWAEKQAEAAKQQEEKDAAARETAAKQAAEERQRQQALENQLNERGDRLREDMRNGDFLRNYRDPPTERAMGRAGSLA